jgi:hypothetical protein
MAMTTCTECKTEISTKAKACPKCGAKVPHTKWWLWIPVGLVAMFLVIGAFQGNTPADRAKSLDRDVISTCWGSQTKRSNTPGESRGIASMCEGLERDFVAKYRVNP